jgi:hypothetical protein
MDRRQDGLKSQSGHGDKGKNPCTYQELNPGHPVCNFTDVAIPALIKIRNLPNMKPVG